MILFHRSACLALSPSRHSGCSRPRRVRAHSVPPRTISAFPPSAVSHAIRSLEETLGRALFLRQGRSVHLTAEGRTLMRHVERGFGELQLGIGNVSAHTPQLLRVHSAPSFAAQWLMPRLRRLLNEVEGLTVRIAAGTDYARFTTDEFD